MDEDLDELKGRNRMEVSQRQVVSWYARVIVGEPVEAQPLERAERRRDVRHSRRPIRGRTKMEEKGDVEHDRLQVGDK